jgi:epoxyqueuosine reductase
MKMEKEGKTKLNRRDFLRLVGLSVGATAVSVAAKPLTQPMQENPSLQYKTFSDPAGRPQRPWWVKTVDTPTIEIDWAKMQRFNERYDPKTNTGSVRGAGLAGYVGKDANDALTALNTKVVNDGVKNNTPGYTLRDQALNASQSTNSDQSFLGPQKATTPDKWGVQKWTGSPEEAARMLRVMMRHQGAATVGFVKLDENTRKLIYSVDPDGKQIVFNDDPQPSETETTRVIPNSAKWVIVYTVQMSGETLKRAPTVIGQQTTTLAYKRGRIIQNSTQEFLRGLGYMCLGESSTNALGIAPAFGVMAGLGELSRLNRLITPEFGPMVRVFKLVTDLPLATDKPIDAGIMKFCRSCKKCAEACGGAALSFETDPTWTTRGPWNNPGHKAYFEDSVKCISYWKAVGTNCGVCFAVCPFAKMDKAWIHEFVKASASTAPFVDGFLRTMDDAFGYGVQKGQDDWWNLDLPEYGTDSSGML